MKKSIIQCTSRRQCNLQGITLNSKQVFTTTYGLNSFSFEASKIWINLPKIIKEKIDVENPDEFMFEINNCSGPECNCGICILCQINLL